MIRVIINNPHAYYPKFPRVIEGETEESVDRQIRRCLSGMKGQYGHNHTKTTVTRVTAIEDVSSTYGLPGAAE